SSVPLTLAGRSGSTRAQAAAALSAGTAIRSRPHANPGKKAATPIPSAGREEARAKPRNASAAAAAARGPPRAPPPPHQIPAAKTAATPRRGPGARRATGRITRRRAGPEFPTGSPAPGRSAPVEDDDGLDPVGEREEILEPRVRHGESGGED